MSSVNREKYTHLILIYLHIFTMPEIQINKIVSGRFKVYKVDISIESTDVFMEVVLVSLHFVFDCRESIVAFLNIWLVFNF